MGTGTGDFLVVLKKVFPLAEICGVDPNSESIEEAKKLFGEVASYNFNSVGFALIGKEAAAHAN